jgi:hypothetical protein
MCLRPRRPSRQSSPAGCSVLSGPLTAGLYGHLAELFDTDPDRVRRKSYAGFWVTRRSGGVVFRHLDDLDAVFESDTCADLRQLICAFQPPPGL